MNLYLNLNLKILYLIVQNLFALKMQREDEKFDGLFMSAVQNAQGIDNFFDALFSFMRRKTDFFSNESASVAKVQDYMEKHIALFKEDHKK